MVGGNKTINEVTTTVGERDVVLERTFDVARDVLFRAFTDPQHITQWWGPKGWSTAIYKMEVKPGGVWHYCMRGPAGEESWGKATYHEIAVPERLVYTDSYADAEGNTVEGMPESRVTMDFLEFEGKTRLTARTQFASTADLEATLAKEFIAGVTETWERLEEYLRHPDEQTQPPQPAM